MRRFVEAHPFHGDSVFSPLELCLQGQKIFVGLEIRILFDHGQQAPKGRGKDPLRLLELGKHFGIIHDLGREGGLQSLRARFDHILQCLLFMRGVALHGGHQIGDQIGPALIDVFDLCPGLFDIFFTGHQFVVGPAEKGGDHHDNSQHHPNPLFHKNLLCAPRSYTGSNCQVNE